MLNLPRVVAHRGASAEAPENTLAAFRRAFDLGCTATELDVHLSKDGVPVVIHDDHLERTTDGTGEVRARTVEELKRLDAGRWFDARFAGERVPTLDECLALARERGAFVNVEVKTDHHPYPGIEEAVLASARRHGVLDRLFVSSFNPATVERVHKLEPRVPTGVIVLGEPTAEEVRAHAAYAQAIGVYVELATPEVVARVHDAKMAAVAWVVNHADVARRLLDSGVDGLITDDPAALKEFL